MRQAATVPSVHGRVAPGYERVAEAFERNFAEHGEVGAAFAAVVGGEPVADLWGGMADRRHDVPWAEDTLVGIFSGTKGLTATCMLLLVERGLLDLETPVCHYWPEFAAEGKQGVLVRHVVSHRAGLPGLATPVTVEEATDDVRMAALLAAQAPITRPGAWHCYHGVTFGWLCGELVRRVDGRSIGRFFQEEIAQPLGLECWIGLPASLEPRVAVIERETGSADEAVPPQGSIGWSVWANPPRFLGHDLAANVRAWHAAEIPATNAIVAARSTARLYACLAAGGELDGVRLCSPATIELGRRCLGRGYDPYLHGPTAFALGFQLQTDLMLLGPHPAAFGHTGAGGSAHGAWPELDVGFSYAMNQLGSLGANDPRCHVLLEALHRAVVDRAS
ncbi:MAG TPA: serine hydrolase domain-containing protein [Conexibacter sp.]|jgi:CubicO group peptidase (beta-lactamase class C family)|nr:serine hydrolase domain-containing protein [Conexibacter sp.]